MLRPFVIRARAALVIMLAALLILPPASAQTAASLSPSPNLQFFDASSGQSLPCVGCTVSTFAAGTSTPLRTYTDSTATTQNGVIITLDSNGYTTSGIWIGGVCYKYVLKNAGGSTVWSQDNICDNSQLLRVALTGATGAAQIGYRGASGDTTITTAAALNSFTLSATYSSLAFACGAANSTGRTLLVVSNFAASPAQSCAANIRPGGGIIAPGSSQVINLSGKIDQIAAQLFDTSAGGAGSILLTGPNEAIFPHWFGAKMDGSTDDLPAWNASTASCPAAGCVLHIPQGSNSFTSAGIVLTHGVPIKVSGGGRTSIISCTGVPCLTANYAGQMITTLDVQESNPAGNAATVGIEVTNGSGSGDQITLRDLTLLGKSAHPNGIGVRFDGVANVAVDNVISSAWDKGGQINAITGPIFSTTIHFIGGHFTGNATWQLENTGCGDCSAFGTIFESGPGLSTSFGIFTCVACHGESGSIDARIKSGASALISLGSTWHGGTIQADAGAGSNNAVFVSYGDDITDLIVNNSSFTMRSDWPTHPPANANVSGSSPGPFLLNDATGPHCLKSGGCTASNTFSFDAPYTGYIFSGGPLSSTTSVGAGTFLQTGPITFSGLGSVAAGQIYSCTDCKVTGPTDNTCVGGGPGAIAFRTPDGWWACLQRN